MSVKPKRTLGPAQFEAYMDFADSLKDGSNNDAIDKFKYNMAVREGYIKPKLESVDKERAEAFKSAIDGLLQAFVPYLDDEGKAVVGGALEDFGKGIANGEGTYSKVGDDDGDALMVDDGCCGDAECVTVCDGDSCTAVCAKDDDGDDGDGKKSKPAPGKKEDSDGDGDDGKPNGKPPVEECGDGKKLQESLEDMSDMYKERLSKKIQSYLKKEELINQLSSGMIISLIMNPDAFPSCQKMNDEFDEVAMMEAARKVVDEHKDMIKDLVRQYVNSITDWDVPYDTQLVKSTLLFVGKALDRYFVEAAHELWKDDGKPNGKPPVEDGVDYDSLADQVLDGATP